MIFETARLIVRKATTSDEDVELFFRLWTDPRVMSLVGFPQGLRITREDIRKRIAAEDDSPYDKKLLVILKETSAPIAECKLGRPNKEGISETDIKILPKFWGRGLGTEIKQALVDYLFRNTDCNAVQGTPNIRNIASQKMQEAIGGRKIGETVYRFPERMRSYTCDVHHYIYLVYREDWEKKQRED